MRLRRGMVRESCDFCHRRKIKCDRLTRNDLGHTSCSQCSLRNVPCRMEDSDDIRLRGRCRPGEAVTTVAAGPPGSTGSTVGAAPLAKRESFGSDDAGTAESHQQQHPQPQSQSQSQSQLPPAPSPSRGLSISTASVPPLTTHMNTHSHSHSHSQAHPHAHAHAHAHSHPAAPPPPQPSHPLATPASISGLDVHLMTPSSHANITTHPQHVLPHHQQQHQQSQQQSHQQHQPQLYTPSPSTATSAISAYGNPASSLTDDLFMEDPFQLNADSIFFLDKIFMGVPETAGWPSQAPSSSPPQPIAASNGLMTAGYPQSLMLTQPDHDFVQQQQQQNLQDYQLHQQHQQHQQQTQQAQQQYQQYQALSQPQTQTQSQSQSQQSQSTTQPQSLPPLPQREVQDGGYDPAPWVRCNISQDIFIAALHAYFEHTTIYMPVLLEDAFWQDYHAGRCSLSIIYALACRGLPFTAGIERNEDKWAMQQRVGTQFRETFFETQLAANNNRGRVRLDDLEALALMVQFKYHKHQGGDKSQSQQQQQQASGGQQASPTPSTVSSPSATALAQLHAHLAGLYLTHDSLVLMTMQSGINGSGGAGSGGVDVGPGGSSSNSNSTSSSDTESDLKAPLSRINDRRILLFWHVYGLDSFQCLDKKTLSRIPDFNIDTVRNLPRENKVQHSTAMAAPTTTSARGYLDAVLDLSVIARKALNTLSNATARRRGVRAEDALHIYHLLDTWLHTECPPHLRHQRDANGRLCLTGDGTASTSGSGTNTPGNNPYVQLHRAVVWILAINCYMQIEDCVSEYGIYQPPKDDTLPSAVPSASSSGGGSTLDTEILYLRIMSETVRHLRDGVDIARSIKTPRWDGSPSSKREYSLADLGTSVVRDCCQGMGVWACVRGISWLKRPLPRVLQSQSSARQQAQLQMQYQHQYQQQQQRQQQAVPPPTPQTLQEQKMREDADRRKHAETYLESATILRAAVATASSHADTMPSLRKLDDLVVELTEGIQQIGK
ncbi:fungal transcriptional regulatory protein [Ophiostoma piceae UAMH 11346]|uniref:Fungal transcriptional regulatory protein n=1 Tax=Ophiostoma piceae (strain UAMH 11346) TaxID=1262450 RepID=S3BSN9_OPHP1|nr:fungal transcriptional regulatory protein [Ophiostoma piceae UAMH 11346]